MATQMTASEFEEFLAEMAAKAKDKNVEAALNLQRLTHRAWAQWLTMYKGDANIVANGWGIFVGAHTSELARNLVGRGTGGGPKEQKEFGNELLGDSIAYMEGLIDEFGEGWAELIQVNMTKTSN
jgi:hypothetical protein